MSSIRTYDVRRRGAARAPNDAMHDRQNSWIGYSLGDQIEIPANALNLGTLDTALNALVVDAATNANDDCDG